MKRTPTKWSLPDKTENDGKTYWRSLDQLANTPEFREFVEREFPNGAAELNSPITRRSFMTLMGASVALAGMTGCRRPEEKILPYTKAPEDSVIGLPTYYATTMTLGAQAIGLLVESNDGRPTKVEGNPHHPQSLGATGLFGQAAILDLYDPDRSARPRIDGADAELEAAKGKIAQKRGELLTKQGAGLHVLSGALVSPTLWRLREKLLAAMPQAVWHTWEPVCDDEARAGSQIAFGEDVYASLHLEHADVILALDCDLLGSEPDALRHARAFAGRRRVEDKADTMNRLYAVEAAWTITGASADHRLRLRPSEVGPFATAVAAELVKLGAQLPPGVAEALPKGAADAKFVAAVAKDLWQNRGNAVISAGRGQPRAVHALVHALNGALGAPGAVIHYVAPLDAGRKLDRESLGELAAALERGEVDTLVVLGSNPAYDAPADLKFAERLKASAGKTTIIHLGSYRDETAELAKIHVPRSHFLEAWGDAVATDGTSSVVQPLIAPLYPSLSDIELASILVDGLPNGKMTPGYALVRESWKTTLPTEAPQEAAAPGSATDGKAAAAGAGAAAGAVVDAAATKKVEVAAADKAKTAAGDKKVEAAGDKKADGAGEKKAEVATAAKAAGEKKPDGDKKPAVAAAPAKAAAPAPAAGAVPAKAAAPATAAAAAPAGAAVAGSGVALAGAVTGPSAIELAFDRHWRTVLHDGLMHEGAGALLNPQIKGETIAAALGTIKALSGDLEIIFQPDWKMYDGRFANNGWLQEQSDPITMLAWDNSAILSVRTAQALGVERDDMIQLTVRGRSVEAAVFIQPGQADKTVTLTLGYGRQKTGRVGTGAGFNAYLLRDSAGLGFDAAAASSTGKKYDDPRDRNFLDITKLTGLVTTQNHSSMEGRPLVREASLTKFREEPDFAKHAVHHPPLKSLWDERPYVGQQWGMAIDLSACIGCGACSTACQAENNIPIVGKAQVRKGRRMDWIRIDRYFSGDTDNPEAISQPVACQQCENAPCENVCPVGATVHSTDGLNDMVYNRCIGTRYCANNCPYKVRRFNYLDWRGEVQDVAKLMYNPDVTLRSRGVMEKCTYCTQRIRGAQRDAKLHGEDKVTDGVITPACAQVCPTEAIVFGDITDENSRVSRVKKSERNYNMLDELNIKPRTSYLARIRNLNPELASNE